MSFNSTTRPEIRVTINLKQKFDFSSFSPMKKLKNQDVKSRTNSEESPQHKSYKKHSFADIIMSDNDDDGVSLD